MIPAMALLLLALMLLAQLVMSRAQLSSYAAISQVLDRVCQALPCTPVSPQRADALLIESSSFERLEGNTYLLQLSLRNTAAHRLALPALELSLSDSQQQVLLRRVITAQELDPQDEHSAAIKDGMLMPGAVWRMAQGLTLQDASDSRISGYRLLAFYP
jgi:hypothetical protein